MSRKITVTLKRGPDESVFALYDAPLPGVQVGDEPARKTPARAPKPDPRRSRVAAPITREPATPRKPVTPDPARAPAVPVAPKITDPLDPDSHGEAYVRMLNKNSVVVAVRAADVPARVLYGFQFIYGEPAVPRVLGNPDRCDKSGKGWAPFPRPGGAGIKSMVEATAVWIKAMQDDRAERDQISKDVDWDWLDSRAAKMMSRYSELTG